LPSDYFAGQNRYLSILNAPGESETDEQIGKEENGREAGGGGGKEKEI
jgi:hypothetical protein